MEAHYLQALFFFVFKNSLQFFFLAIDVLLVERIFQRQNNGFKGEKQIRIQFYISAFYKKFAYNYVVLHLSFGNMNTQAKTTLPK